MLALLADKSSVIDRTDLINLLHEGQDDYNRAMETIAGLNTTIVKLSPLPAVESILVQTEDNEFPLAAAQLVENSVTFADETTMQHDEPSVESAELPPPVTSFQNEIPWA